jgi:general nucleoside transport system permease protein
VNLLALGITRALLRRVYHSSANSPNFSTYSWLAGGRSWFLQILLDPLVWFFIAVTWMVHVGMQRTRFGLRVRAVGEAPNAAALLGVSVGKTRYLAVCLGSAIAGLGGAALAFDAGQFQAQMSAGKGFIALIVVLLSGKKPLPASLLCLGLAIAEGAQIVLQSRVALPSELLSSLPYLAALLALMLRPKSPETA